MNDRNLEMPPVGVTMGCPSGVGPEIVLRLFEREQLAARVSPFVVLGDCGVLQRCAEELAIPCKIKAWNPGEGPSPRRLNVLACSALDLSDFAWGRPNLATGKAMARYIEEAVRLIGEGRLSAMATCPIGKKTLQQAGYSYPGHTEMLATLCHSQNYAMMMAAADFKVCLATIHQPVNRVAELLSVEGLCNLLELIHDSLKRDFAVASPRIATAGLNPHAGENGLFGDEEQRIISPAVAQARSKGLEVDGPLPPDTVFYKTVRQKSYDAVLAMYHDQGLIPFKLLHFEDGVNVTLGLSIVRTSVDHGTAYDIAGRGLASYRSLLTAVQMAADIAVNRRTYGEISP
ncbi:MAG: 4-hydroxythreonine-4-phosphate dehydrogenase PdxA [Deltaproteobacteria bacterium]